MGGGTIQWMSPELLNPEGTNATGVRPTKQSDCYALGMVVYEVLSGQPPFAPRTAPIVIRKVLEGELPERPQGEEGILFTNAIWTKLEQCWIHSPGDRASAKDVLSCLEGRPLSELPSSPNVDGDLETESNDQLDDTLSDSSTFSPFHLGFAFTNPCGVPAPSITHGEKEQPDLPQCPIAGPPGFARPGLSMFSLFRLRSHVHLVIPPAVSQAYRVHKVTGQRSHTMGFNLQPHHKRGGWDWVVGWPTEPGICSNASESSSGID